MTRYVQRNHISHAPSCPTSSHACSSSSLGRSSYLSLQDAHSPGENQRLLSPDRIHNEIPTENDDNVEVDVDTNKLRERLQTVIVHKRGFASILPTQHIASQLTMFVYRKMVDVASILPFSLSRGASSSRSPSDAGTGYSAKRRSSRPSPLPRQWDPYTHAHESSRNASLSRSRQPSPTPSMNTHRTHTSPRSSAYETTGLDGSLASLANLPGPYEYDRASGSVSVARGSGSGPHVKILDYGTMARGRRSRSRGGRLGGRSASASREGAQGIRRTSTVSPVEEGVASVCITVESVEPASGDQDDDEDSIAGDLGGPEPEVQNSHAQAIPPVSGF
jgi:hypothetical protein